MSQPCLAIEDNQCVTFSLKDCPKDSPLIAKVRKNLQKDLTYQLPEKEEAIKIELCQKGIRQYSEQQIDLMAFLACVHYELGNFDKATVLFEEILLFAEKTKNEGLIILAHNNLGYIANTNKFRLSAYFHYQKLLEFGEKNENRYGKIMAFLNLGVFDFQSGSYEEAEKKYLICLSLLEELPNPNIEHWVIHRLGELKNAQNKKKEAIDYFERAVKYWEETNNYKGVSFSYQQLGVIYMFKNPDLAEKYFYKALEAGKRSEYNFSHVEMLLSIGVFYMKQKEYRKALIFFEKILVFKIQKKVVPRIRTTYQLMAECYSALGMIEKANESHEAYLKEESKYSKKFLANNLKSIENVERLILKKKEYELIEKEKEYTKERLFFQKILTFFSLLALFLAVSLALIFFRKNKKNRAQKERLAILNQQNKQQAEDLSKAKVITENQKKELEIEMVKKALVLSQQGEVIQSIASQLENMESNNGTIAIRKEVTKVKDNSLWTELNLQITQSNEAFFEILLEENPKLTQADLRLCAFLKMNMNTKEIANLTFKNPESIKVARSRLRKKLGLTHSNLTFKAFFTQIMRSR